MLNIICGSCFQRDENVQFMKLRFKNPSSPRGLKQIKRNAWELNSCPGSCMKFLTAWTPPFRLNCVSRTRTNPPPISHVNHGHGAADASTPTLFKGGRGRFGAFCRFLSVSPGQHCGMCPSGLLGRWSENPPTLGDQQKAQQPTCTFRKNKKTVYYTRKLGNNPYNKNKSRHLFPGVDKLFKMSASVKYKRLFAACFYVRLLKRPDFNIFTIKLPPANMCMHP